MAAVRYLDEVLDPIVKLYAAIVGPSFVLMHIIHVFIVVPSLTTFWGVSTYGVAGLLADP